MIGVRRFKQAAAVVLAVVTTVIALTVVRQAGTAIVRSATGADPASIFNDVPPAPADVSAALRWLPDPERDGRVMEPRTRLAVTDAYARALAAIDRAGRGDPGAALADYLGGPALDAAEAAPPAPGGATDPADDTTVATYHVRQDLQLDFYSDDGSVVAIAVPHAEVVRVVDSGDHRTVVETAESWRFVMLLEDGNWRIQQIESTHSSPRPEFGPPRSLARVPVGVNALAAQSGDPTWASYDADQAVDDLDRAVALGFDTVRVFVAAPELGEVRLEAVTSFLDDAAERDLDVVVTLFDGAADHSVDEWDDDAAYLRRIVEALGDHPALALWDLKNEPDLDDARSGGPQIVDAWLARTAVEVRRLDPDTPLTIGWSEGSQARRLLDGVDVVSFHHFGDPDELRVALDGLVAATDRPVMVSEYGRPAWVGFVRGDQPAAQARDVAAMLAVLDDAGVGHLVWQLRDTDAAVEPGVVAGRASRSYGLHRADGSTRPLADVFAAGDVPGAGVVERLRSWLPLLVLVAALVAVLAAVRSRRRTACDGHVDGPADLGT